MRVESWFMGLQQTEPPSQDSAGGGDSSPAPPTNREPDTHSDRTTHRYRADTHAYTAINNGKYLVFQINIRNNQKWVIWAYVALPKWFVLRMQTLNQWCEFRPGLSVGLTNGRQGECLGNLFENSHYFYTSASGADISSHLSSNSVLFYLML